MALGDLFKLAKLTIRGFKTSKRDVSEALGKFEVQYNPETLSMKHESVYQPPAANGANAGKNRWSYAKPSRLSVELVLDGTGADHLGIELVGGLVTVPQQIKKFLAICYWVNGETHEPSYLKLQWGALEWGAGALEPSFDCRLESVDIKYTSFDRSGAPIHASLTAAFVEDLHPPKKAAKANLQSPDLTHRRVVVAGDTLPLLCRQIYGSPAYYLRVAQVNGLDDFRNLSPGQELIFPPFERPGRE